MRTQSFVTTAIALAAAACQTAPVEPTVIAPPAVAAVPTVQPLVWDRREELAAWVNNGATVGAATLEGEGTGAVIRIEAAQEYVNLKGPDFDPPLTDVQEARVRYRWLDAGANGNLGMNIYLRPPNFTNATPVPRLFYAGADVLNEKSGEWVDRVFTSNNTSTPPYAVQFANLSMPRAEIHRTTPIHGTVEIDAIALIRR